MTWAELNTHTLTVYSTTWCPDCVRLKRILDKLNVTYTEIDIDKDPKAAATLKEKTNRTAIPFVEIDGGTMVQGWHPGAPGGFDEAAFLKAAEAALA